MSEDITSLLEQVSQLKDSNTANEAKISQLSTDLEDAHTELASRQAEIVRLQGLVAHYVSTPEAPSDVKPKSFNERYNDYLKAVNNTK